MIEPDKYAEEYFNLKYPYTQKDHFTKIYNFNKLPSDKKIVFIKFDISFNPSLTIIERMDWDLSEEKKSPQKFSEIFIHNLKDLIDKDLIRYNINRISKQIYTQILDHIDKNTILQKYKISKKENELVSNNITMNSSQVQINKENNLTTLNSLNNYHGSQSFNLMSNNANNGVSYYCNNCNITLYNSEICMYCNKMMEKKTEKNTQTLNQSFNFGTSTNINIILNNTSNSNNPEEIQRQTERQRILEARQKNINLSESVPVSYTNDGKEKKICKKCGEVNMRSAAECRDCKHKFPLVTHFDINVDQTFSVHFWDKISKNSTIQQLKNFADFFNLEDFCSLKYLYEKVKKIIKYEFEEILTEEAIADVYSCLEKAYFSLSNTTQTVKYIILKK